MGWHTGLTPVDGTFPPNPLSCGNEYFPVDSTTFDVTDLDFCPSALSASGLSAKLDATDQDSHTFIATDSFANESQTRERLVGPSQGLCAAEGNYMPSRPLDMLTAAADAPGAPFSLRDQPMNDVETSWGGLAGFCSDTSCAIGSGVQTGTVQQMEPSFSNNLPNNGPATIPTDNDFVSNYAHGTNIYRDTFDFGHSGIYHIDSPITFMKPQAPLYDLFPTRLVGSSPESASPSPSLPSSPLSAEKKPARIGPDRYYDEKPTKPAGKPWVRVNATTQGKTSRTGKINHYNPEAVYSAVPHPLNSAWATSSGRSFRYNRWHELTSDCMPASQLGEFLFQHPRTENCRLTLYVQRSPADSKRRYPTSSLDRCRFSECPMRVHGNKGSFLHGHYRVALDELSYRHGCDGGEQRNDPFHVAGYVHLYCLERFLDLPALCASPNIRVEADGRAALAKEPNGSFAPALRGGEHDVAARFIEAARAGRVQDRPEWAQYPEHVEHGDGGGHVRVAAKRHKHTLNYALQLCKNAARGGRVMSRLKPSNVAVHRGDLEMYCLGRKGLLSEQRVAEIMAELEDDGGDAVGPTLGGKRRIPGSAERPSSPFSSSTAKKVKY